MAWSSACNSGVDWPRVPRQPALVRKNVVARAHFRRRRWPNAGQARLTRRATAVGRQTVGADEVAVALDDRGAASRAARVFPVADLSGQVAGVHEAQPLG